MAEAISNNRTRDFLKSFLRLKVEITLHPVLLMVLIMNMTLNKSLVLNIRIFIIVYHTTVREWRTWKMTLMIICLNIVIYHT